jgi:hypothetical protein
MSNVIELNFAEIDSVVGGVSSSPATACSAPTTATALQVVHKPATSSSLQASNVDIAAFVARYKR